MNVTYLNKNFRFVYTRKPFYFLGRLIVPKRHLVGAGKLSYYIGSANAETVQKSALNCKTDKVTCKFRKAGKIEIYVK